MKKIKEFTKTQQETTCFSGMVFKTESKKINNSNIEVEYGKIIIQYEDQNVDYISINLTEINKYLISKNEKKVQNGDIVEVTGTLYNKKTIKNEKTYNNLTVTNIEKFRIISRNTINKKEIMIEV